MTQAYVELVTLVRDVKKQWRLRHGMDGVAAAVGVAALGLTAAVILDQWVAPGLLGRATLALLMWAAIGIVAWRWLAVPLGRQRPDDYFAALVEQRCPGVGNRLINALQLGREEAPPSPQLVEAIVADGVAAMTDLRTGVATAPDQPWRSNVLAGVGLALLATTFAVAGPAARTSAVRVLMPFAAIAPFAWTKIALTPATSTRLLEGSALDIEAALTGRSAEVATLHWSDDQGKRQAAAMRRVSADQFAYRLASVTRPLDLHVTAGDGRSNRLLVSVDPRPHLTVSEVRYRYPDYTRLPERVVPAERFGGQVSAWKGSQVTLVIASSKPLQWLRAIPERGTPINARPGADGASWSLTADILDNDIFSWRMVDDQGYDVTEPSRWTLTVEQDQPPTIAILKPGKDVQLRPEEVMNWQVAAQDDLGLADVKLLGIVNPRDGMKAEGQVLHQWLLDPAQPAKQRTLDWEEVVSKLPVQPGDRLQYWAVATDAYNLSADGPHRAESRRYHLLVLTPKQAQSLLDRQIQDYVKVVTELLRLQRLNRAETEAVTMAQALIQRQMEIRQQTLDLAQTMEQNAFPARTIIVELRDLATAPMAEVVAALERMRDASQLEQRKTLAGAALPTQDTIIVALEDILKRLSRDAHVRRVLRKMEQQDPQAREQILSELGKLGDKLDKFLAEQRELAEKYEKLAKQDEDKVSGEDLNPLADVEHRIDRWKEWFKDSVDAITKLPRGFAEDSQLAETVSTIFEEIEKKPRLPTKEIATPVEEGIKAVGTEILEDLEIWMPDRGDNIKWVMEDPTEGAFEVPEATLPDNLQDMVGDLIEDVEEFDEEADDVTGAWGGNIPQSGWDIMDGPISSFSATGKTGNQLPNASEITGRSGAGRRGRASGQMVGQEYGALEGRPTPARVTAERYDEGQIDAKKQLDPRGATGGGKKTGAGQRGLQGGTPPDFVKDMERLKDKYRLLQEKAERLANQMMSSGRPANRVNRALELLDASQQDLRDLRYQDAARKRQSAMNELRTEQSGIDQAVALSLQKARLLPPELRQQIAAGAQQAMPEGYEHAVGDYFKALSEAVQPGK